jgi:hypothetical protein
MHGRRQQTLPAHQLRFQHQAKQHPTTDAHARKPNNQKRRWKEKKTAIMRQT